MYICYIPNVSGTQEKKPGQQHLYVVKDPVNDDPRRSEPHCITCETSAALWGSRLYYSNCSHFDAMVSPMSLAGCQYYILK